jgi:hypothetical protein
VRYGENGVYYYRVATNSIPCSNETFGDPLYGVFKHCDYRDVSDTPAVTYTPSPTGSQTVTLNAVADTYVRSDQSSTNLGRSSRLESDGSPTKYVYIRFDLSSVQASRVNSAKLHLYVIDSSSVSHTVKLVEHPLWGEYDMTYNNRHARNPVLTTFGSVSSGNWIEIDLTASVHDHAGGYYSIAIETNGSDGVDFNSRETSNKPNLVIQ